jgi:hypothetical protein
VFSLHPVTIDDVRAFLAASDTNADEYGARGMERLRRSDSRGTEMVGQALATFLAGRQPSFVLTEISLTNWEAQIDRGIGMLMRPPARILIEAGMERSLAQQFPIRLDHNAGSMAGAYVPARLMDEFAALLESRLERHLRRLREADLDPVANMGLLLEAAAYAGEHRTGLIEAAGVVDGLPPGTPVVIADRKRLPNELRKRLEEAAKPPKKPGLVARLRGARPQPEANGFERAPAASDEHGTS